MRSNIMMECTFLITCIAAAAEQSTAYDMDAMEVEDGTVVEQNAVHNNATRINDIIMATYGVSMSSEACSVCRQQAFSISNSSTGDMWDALSAFFDSGACLECSQIIVHLGCALASLHPIRCQKCNKEACYRNELLDEFFAHLRSGSTESVWAKEGAYICALIALESMQHSQIVMALQSYDMTIAELETLRRVANKMYVPYPRLVRMIDSVVWVKTVLRVRTIDELLGSLTDLLKINVALPVLSNVITPYLIEKADNEQLVQLIKLVASYRGFYMGARNALLMKIVDTIEFVTSEPFGNDSAVARWWASAML